MQPSWRGHPYPPYTQNQLYPMAFTMTGDPVLAMPRLGEFPVTTFPAVIGHRVIINETPVPVHIRSHNNFSTVPPGSSMAIRRVPGLEDTLSIFSAGVWSTLSLDTGSAKCGPGGFAKITERGHKICSFPNGGLRIVMEGRFVRVQGLGRGRRHPRHHRRHQHDSTSDSESESD